MAKLLRNGCIDAMQQIRELLGDETILSEVNNYFSSDQVSDFLESLDTDYELNLPCFRAEN